MHIEVAAEEQPVERPQYILNYELQKAMSNPNSSQVKIPRGQGFP